MATEKTSTTPVTEQAVTEKTGLESSRYSKQEQQRMSDGMVP